VVSDFPAQTSMVVPVCFLTN